MLNSILNQCLDVLVLSRIRLLSSRNIRVRGNEVYFQTTVRQDTQGADPETCLFAVFEEKVNSLPADLWFEKEVAAKIRLNVPAHSD